MKYSRNLLEKNNQLVSVFNNMGASQDPITRYFLMRAYNKAILL